MRETIAWIIVGANIASIAWAFVAVMMARRVTRHAAETMAAILKARGFTS